MLVELFFVCNRIQYITRRIGSCLSGFRRKRHVFISIVQLIWGHECQFYIFIIPKLPLLSFILSHDYCLYLHLYGFPFYLQFLAFELLWGNMQNSKWYTIFIFYFTNSDTISIYFIRPIHWRKKEEMGNKIVPFTYNNYISFNTNSLIPVLRMTL